MRTRMLRIALVVALCATFVPISTGSAFARSIDGEYPLVIEEYGQVQPAIDYPYVVYKTETGSDSEFTDIYAYNMITGQKFPICDVMGEQANPDIYGDLVVYSDDRNDPDSTVSNDCNVYMYDISTGEESVVASETWGQGNPSIYGDVVAWVDWRNQASSWQNADIYMKNLTTGVESAVATDSAYREQEPVVWGDYITYRYDDSYDDVNLYKISTKETITIAEGMASPYTTYSDPYVADGIVAYSKYSNNNNYSIMMYDIQSGVETTVSTALTNNRWHPEVGGGWIVWQDRRNSQQEVWGYNLESGEETCLVAAEYDAATSTWTKYGGRAAVGDDWLVYHDHRDEGLGHQDSSWEDLYGKYLGAGDAPTQEMPLEGPTRYETAVEVSMQSFPHGSESVVIATGENWPDALAGASFAGAVDAPILLVGDETADSCASDLPAAVADEIERLGATSAYILGGEAAIDPLVQDDIESIIGTEAARFAGTDRYETACVVASETVTLLGGEWDGTAFATTGRNWPDALAAAPLAAHAGYPLFLAGEDGMSAETEACMDDLGVTGAIVLGGTVAMPLSFTAQMAALDINEVDRIGGDTRYETAALISEYGVAELGMSFDTLGISTGVKFPDALSAGAALGQEGYTMMLTPGTYLHDATALAIEANAADISQIRYAGGPNAVGDAVRAEISGYLY